MDFLKWLKHAKHIHTTAVIVAAGSATRMGGIDKIMAKICGKPVIVHTIRAFSRSDDIDEIVLVVRQDRLEEIRKTLKPYRLKKITAIVPGGDTRMDSVQAGLNAVSKKTGLVAIQDGARPLVTGEIIHEAVKAAEKCQAAAPAIPVKDTIKVIGSDGKTCGSPDRSTLRAVQTPQVFDKDLLNAAWKLARQEEKEYTDDCGAMEGMGMKVYLTSGSEENLKITTPFDLKVAELIMKGRKS